MTDGAPQQAKNVVDQFIAEGGYEIGGPGTRMSKAEVEAVIDELSAAG
jgi:hypothetical protein